jgi:hypothetical protein
MFTMNKNVVIITSMSGQVDTSCEEFCLNTWKYWTDKNNIDLIVLKDPLTDVNHMKPTWQRWYVWKILENNNLDYEKVALVDVDTMIRWDSPNFFDLINNQLGVCSDNDNIGWVKLSLEGYKNIFPTTDLNWTEYFNCGFIVMDKSQKDLCNEIINFWDKNQINLISLQNTLRKGTDQTPVNYIVKKSKTNVKYLDKRFNLTHLNRKEILQDFMFVDCGYVWHFNGFDKTMRTPLMSQTWNKIKNNYGN